MRLLMKLMSVLLFAMLLPATGLASGIDVSVYTLTFKPVALPSGGGPVDIEFIYAPKIAVGNGRFRVELETVGELEYSGEMSWEFEATVEKPFSKLVEVVIPPNDTTGILAYVYRDNEKWRERFVYFAVAGDSTEYWGRDPRTVHRKRHAVQPDTTKYEIILDLSNKLHYDFLKKYEEQLGALIETGLPDFYRFQATKETIRELRMELFPIALIKKGDGTAPDDTMQAELTVQLDVGDSAKLSLAEDVLGSFSEGRQPGKYRLNITFENLLKLHKSGIQFRLIDQDSSKSLGGATIEQQGALDPQRSPTSLPGISLDTTLGQIDATTLSLSAESIVNY